MTLALELGPLLAGVLAFGTLAWLINRWWDYRSRSRSGRLS